MVASLRILFDVNKTRPFQVELEYKMTVPILVDSTQSQADGLVLKEETNSVIKR